MIAFDLRCAAGHVFEGWFRTAADFDAQAERGLIACPTCGDQSVSKAVMAPHVGRKGNQISVMPPAPPPVAASAIPPASSPAAAPMMAGGNTLPPPLAAMAAALAAAQAEALPRSTWVGDQFASRARAMHDGTEEPALIHGQATRAEADALLDDGIAVLPLLVPVVPPDQQN